VPSEKRITRAATLEDLRDLLAAPPHATLAYLHDGELQATPVALEFSEGRYFVALPAGEPAPEAEGRVSLLVDDGCYHTELRGVRVDGTAAQVTAQHGRPPGDEAAWLEIVPRRTTAWDYGAMRQR
jgi:hypothetical protein